MTITVLKSGSMTFEGDGITLYAAIVLRSAIGLLQKGIKPTRGYTMTKALAACERYTGQKYKRTESARAVQDLTVWIELMKSAVPVEHAQ